ncbi:DUF3226 domain-containing protein [Lamprocystis purpurea]|jgi:hypothetical protein|uniref:DUF3226 domain-containing protein n=1 Tax=Lamprocystis purpurea TaxID=61598 RepID=UPI000361FBC5|nr:DUF3226 domain-containing protein [Lamprocystis purpurea]
MSASKVRSSAPHRLIVEGRDDQWSIIALTAKYGWDWDNPAPHYPFVADAKGDTLALESLPLAVRSYRRVGVVLDADFSPERRWQSVCDLLSDEGFPVPTRPDPEGTVVERMDGKRIGVWLMPDNQNPGKLEDFLALLVPPADPCWAWAEESTTRAVRLGAGFTPSDFIKAHIHTWLAWQKEPGQPFGTAIRAATFAHDAAAARRFVAWMERLFA